MVSLNFVSSAAKKLIITFTYGTLYPVLLELTAALMSHKRGEDKFSFFDILFNQMQYIMKLTFYSILGLASLNRLHCT